MLNQAQIIGHLGKDPETRYLPSGEAVCNFSLATTEKWKDKNTGEQKEATEWHRITTFGKLAEICGQYLKKGSQAFVQGKLVTRKYTDKDGIDRYATEVRAETLKMLGGRDSSQGERSAPPAQRQAAPQRQQRPAAAPAPSGFDDMDDDIPF
jgi:single-strand DNA-binding protein